MSDYKTYIDDGARVLRGLTALAGPLNLTHLTKAIYEPIFLDFKARHLAYGQARHSQTNSYITLREKRATADEFLLNGRGYLKGFLGETWSPLWAPLGFINGSLALPDTDVDRCALLENVKTYFTNHPAHENAAREYTAAKAEALCAPLTDARTNVEHCKFDSRTKSDARKTAKALLDEKISDLRGELELVLGPTDPRWLKFFDRIPGDLRAPEKVEDVTATARPGGIIVLDWPDAARAARYRVLKQVVGVDAAMVVAETVDESAAQLTAPTGATVRLQIVATNSVGDAPASEAVELRAA